jgi:hypothetical protein
MKRILYGIVVLGLLLGSQLQATAAQKSSKQVVFYATGEFESGDQLRGTVTIDTTHGTVLWADLTVFDLGNNVVATFGGTPGVGPPFTYTNLAGDLVIEVYGFNSTVIALAIPSTSLKKYAGGSLVAYESYWSWPTIQFSQRDPLLYGSLEP